MSIFYFHCQERCTKCIFDFDTFLKAKKLSCPSRALNRNPSSSKRDLLLIGRVLCCPGDDGHVNAGTSVSECVELELDPDGVADGEVLSLWAAPRCFQDYNDSAVSRVS